MLAGFNRFQRQHWETLFGAVHHRTKGRQRRESWDTRRIHRFRPRRQAWKQAVEQLGRLQLPEALQIVLFAANAFHKQVSEIDGLRWFKEELGSVARSAFHDRPVKETRVETVADVMADGERSGALSENGDLPRISAERLGVPAEELQRHSLILNPHVPQRPMLILLPQGLLRQEAENANSVVWRDDDDAVPLRQFLAVVRTELEAVAHGEEATVDPEHDGEKLVLLPLLRSVHVHVQAVLVTEVKRRSPCKAQLRADVL
mmetsp:Transcript_16504/g.62764  ORF Transcript_16504/g.62764 Transcript_16504/m.62764 type:complete len:260 (+) Transcript_16504:539-1318(+)